MILNQIKTVLLLGLLTSILLAIGAYFGGQQGIVFAFIFAMIMNFGSYWFSDKLVLRMYRAREASVSEYPRLHQIINELAEEAKIPKPKVYILPTHVSNAFATGRNPHHSAIAVTAGILDLLTESELKAVLAHEMGHIKNRDILVSTIAATIASVISFIAFMARWAAIFGGFGGRDRGRNIIELLVLAILAPIIALIIRLAISRSREYLADETSAKLTKHPEFLASALRKIEQDTKVHPMRMGSETTSHLFIVNPFRASALLNLFSTHPPVEKRIEKLNSIKIK